MKALIIALGWMMQMALFAAMAYGVYLIGGEFYLGMFLLVSPIPLSLIGFFNVKAKV
jgi:hypothetical protein